MAKSREVFVATSAVTKACSGRACVPCAARATRCGAWLLRPAAKPERRSLAASSAEPQRLAQVAEHDEPRCATGLEEALDRVLGGGLVLGSVAPAGRRPGIGKSTMLLQAGDALSRATPTRLRDR
jgi:DNA repair protein RadA/Sms